MTLSVAKPHRLNHAVLLEGSETLAFGALTTSPTYSTVLEAKGFKDETFYFNNSTDVTLTVQIQVSPDGLTSSDWYDVGTTLAVSPAATGFRTAGTDYHPFVRIKITHAGAPASGSFVMKSRAQSTA